MPLEKQRLRLLGGLAVLAAQTGAEMTCVFDGAELAAPVLLAPPRGVRVLFSKPGVTADELIRQLVRAEPPGRPVVVVSTDREVADGVAKAGCPAGRIGLASQATCARRTCSRAEPVAELAGRCRGRTRQLPITARVMYGKECGRVTRFFP